MVFSLITVLILVILSWREKWKIESYLKVSDELDELELSDFQQSVRGKPL